MHFNPSLRNLVFAFFVGPWAAIASPVQESPGAAAPSSEQPAVIRIVCSAGLSGGKPLLANTLTTAYQQRALEDEFRPDGIPIEWSFLGDKRTRMDLYARSLADFTNMGPVDTVAARAAGCDYTVVMALRHFDAKVRLAVRGDSSLRTVADLKGRRIATYPNHFYQLTLYRMLEHHGLGRDDFTFAAQTKAAAAVATLGAGESEARLIDLETEYDEDAHRGLRVLFDPGRDPSFSGVGKLCVSGEFERRYPAIVQRVVTTLVRVAAGLPDGDGRSAVLAEWATSPAHRNALDRAYAGRSLKEVMSPLMDDYFLAGLRRDSDDTRRFGMIAPDADLRFEGWVEPKYLQHALIELGLEDCWAERDAKGTLTTFARTSTD